ncbi:MAG: amino acid adenylation domain-containing protein [Clostridia bacterium]|nr:amino acid adenylation domain-containing protein [Clostridia bacterium]
MIKNVLEYLEQTVKRYSNKTAIRTAEKEVTFAELEAGAKKLASFILSKNPGRNKPIPVFLPKSAESIFAFLGVAYSGNFYVPIDITLPAERIEKILTVLEPSLIVSDAENAEKIKKISKAEVLLQEDCDKMEVKEEAIRGVLRRMIDTDPLYVLFTSGSTGMPKGVTISHRSVIDYIEWATAFFAFCEKDVLGNQAPFYFDNSILDIYTMLKTGATLVIIPESLFIFPVKLFRFMMENQVNSIFWVPSALSVVAMHKDMERSELPCLKKVLFCGEVMPTKTLNFWRKLYPNALFANLYGPTEITDVCSCYVVDREFEDDESLPIGFPCNNTDILVLKEDNQEVEAGEIGELCVRGTCLSLGYYGDSEKTAEVFVQNPLNQQYLEKIYKTGDLVKYNGRGELIYVCRKDFQIKHQGHRIELGEIETAVYSLEKIKQCAALYDEGKKQICLFCSVCDEMTEKEVFSELKKKLPQYMLPAKIRIEEGLPLNANGKIDRKLLKTYL